MGEKKVRRWREREREREREKVNKYVKKISVKNSKSEKGSEKNVNVKKIVANRKIGLKNFWYRRSQVKRIGSMKIIVVGK